MNKKQLNLQNASLFAELERKAKEIEILSIRLEDTEKKLSAMENEKSKADALLDEAKELNASLEDRIKVLEAELAEAEEKANQNAISPDTETEATAIPESLTDTDKVETTEEVQEPEVYEESEKEEAPAEDTYNTEEENLTVFPPAREILPEDDEEDTNEAITPYAEQSFSPSTTEATPPPAVTPVIPHSGEPITLSDDLLRDYGAKIIGRVTRITAEVLSKISNVNDDVAESLKTLALGKNESFKFRIMELAKQKDNAEKSMAEMDLLAEEAITYLRSI